MTSYKFTIIEDITLAYICSCINYMSEHRVLSTGLVLSF